MKYKTTIEREAVQFTGDLTQMSNWFLERCCIGKIGGEWYVYDNSFDTNFDINIGDFIVDDEFEPVKILDAETFNKNYTPVNATGEEHA